jgi:hypothetical protein
MLRCYLQNRTDVKSDSSGHLRPETFPLKYQKEETELCTSMCLVHYRAHSTVVSTYVYMKIRQIYQHAETSRDKRMVELASLPTT